MEEILQIKVDDLTRQLNEKNALLEKRDAEVMRLELMVKDLRRRLYGSNSERDLGDPFHQQGLLDELLVQVEEANRKLAEAEEDLRKEVANQTTRKSLKRKKKKRLLDELVPEDLPREEVIIDVPDDEKICPETGEPLRQIGEERSAKLAYRPGHYFIKEIVRPKYAAPNNPGHGVVCATMPDAAIPNSHFDESFAASVIVDKVAYHLPLYRLCELQHNR
jgi:transposase